MSDDKQENVKEEGKNGDARTLIHLTEHLSVYSDDKLKILYEEVGKRLNWLKFMSNAYADKILTDEEKAMRKSHIALMSDIESKQVTEPNDIVARLAEIFPKYAEVFSINVPAAIPKSREEALAKKVKASNGSIEPSRNVEMERINWEMIRSAPERYVKELNYLYIHLLQKGTDYGVIPGTQRPTLYKAGAELLAMHFGFTTETIETTEVKEIFGVPMFTSSARTVVYHNGIAIGDGRGFCSTGETKYSFRWLSEKKLPKNIDKNSLYSEEGEYGKRYRVPVALNETMDVVNTVIKMAVKRSYVDAVIRVTGASRIFTQDLEDLEGVF
jgi:hypothetical protein